MSEADVVVIGGGLAGTFAALGATRTDPDATVALVTGTESTLQQASGLIDVFGYTPGGDGPLADPFEAIPSLPSSHPYRTVGTETVRTALSVFDEITAGQYEGADTDANALVPTSFGRLKPTARYPATVERGLASERRETLFVGFEHLPSFDGPTMVTRLEESVPYRLNGITVQFPAEERDPVAMARALDENRTTDDGEAVRDVLASRIRTFQAGEERIGLPPVLGIEAMDEIVARLESEFRVPVFEVPMGPPSVPGRRLAALLAQARFDAAIDEYVGSEAVGVDSDASGGDGEIVDAVHLSDGTTLSGGEFVLATGGVLGGGVSADRESVRERLFGCHVDAPADRYEWSDDEAFGDHAFARFGVAVDDAMRPLAADGTPEYENLRAAGHVLGGFDFPAEKSGSGVSIASGYAAGRDAVRAVR